MLCMASGLLSMLRRACSCSREHACLPWLGECPHGRAGWRQWSSSLLCPCCSSDVRRFPSGHRVKVLKSTALFHPFHSVGFCFAYFEALSLEMCALVTAMSLGNATRLHSFVWCYYGRPSSLTAGCLYVCLFLSIYFHLFVSLNPRFRPVMLIKVTLGGMPWILI